MKKAIIWIQYFDNSDTNNDGVLDNPGSVLYYKPTRTGQKTNHSIGWGISMNITIPLDKRHNETCSEIC